MFSAVDYCAQLPVACLWRVPYCCLLPAVVRVCSPVRDGNLLLYDEGIR